MLFNKIVLIAALYIVNINAMQIIGHRGACGYEPDNTVLSFNKALELSVDMVELDVQACKTGELVIFHDFQLGELGNISDMPFEQIRSILLQKRGQIPVLEEVINCINRRVPINIELKGLGVTKAVCLLLQEYFKKGWCKSDFCVSSFHHQEALSFREIIDDIPIGFLYRYTFDIDEISQLKKNDFVGLHVEQVSQELVHKLHEKEIKVYVYTVNDYETANALKGLGVDGIFSNYPDVVR